MLGLAGKLRRLWLLEELVSFWLAETHSVLQKLLRCAVCWLLQVSDHVLRIVAASLLDCVSCSLTMFRSTAFMILSSTISCMVFAPNETRRLHILLSDVLIKQ